MKPGQLFEVLRPTTLHTAEGKTVKVEKYDMLEYLGRYNARGHYQSDPVPEDHFRFLGGSQLCDEDHPECGAEGPLSPLATNWGVVKPGYLSLLE